MQQYIPRAFFDVFVIEQGPTFHGHCYSSGECRSAISWASKMVLSFEESLKNKMQPFVFMLELLNEIQQSIYCYYEPTIVVSFRLYVITRVLADAIHRYSPILLRHIYWANLYIALPGFYYLYRNETSLPNVLEEKFEHSFQSNKRHFSNKGGQFDLQEIQWRIEHSEKKQKLGSNRFLFRVSNFRDVRVKRGLVNIRWLNELKALFPDILIEDEDDFLVFHTSGRNSTVTVADDGWERGGEEHESAIFVDR